jgi:hypothetical protein
MDTNDQLAAAMMSGESLLQARSGGVLLSFFHTLSNAQLFMLLLVVGLTMSTIAPYLVRRYAKWEPSEPLAKGAEESFKVLISLCLLLLAFCLVRAQGDHRSVEDLVSREATVLIKLDRAYGGFNTPEADKLRGQLKRYASEVVSSEWKLMPQGERSEKASDSLAALSAGTRSLDPTNAPQQIARAEILSAFTQLSDLREARLSASRVELPGYLWQAIATAVGLLTILAWFQAPLKKMLAYCGGVTCALTVLLTVLISTAGIFEGENAVTAAPIAKAVAVMGKKAEPADKSQAEKAL